MTQYKIKHALLLVSVLTFGLSSCYRDDSVGATRPLSTITIKPGELQSEYTVHLGEELTIAAPSIEQANGAKPLSYSWEVNYQVVSTEQTLRYKPTAYGTFAARLKVSNEDGASYQTFTVTVQPDFISGLYALGTEGGRTVMSYFTEGRQDAYHEDILSATNPSRDFSPQAHGASIISIDNSAYGLPDKHYLNLAYGGQILRFDADRIEAVASADAGGTVQSVGHDPFERRDYYIIDGLLWGKSYTSRVLARTDAIKTMQTEYPQLKLSAHTAIWRSDHSWQDGGVAVFDDTEGRLFLLGTNVINGYFPFAERNVNPFAGQQLQAITSVGEGSLERGGMKLILLTKSGAEYKLSYLFPGHWEDYEDDSANRPRPRQEHAQVVVPASLGIDAHSILYGLPQRDLVLISAGNKIYDYVPVSAGNFPTAARYTLGLGETVVSMVASYESKPASFGARPSYTERVLYVATTSASGSSIYAFDLETHQQLWVKRGLAATIQQLVWRQS